MNHYTPLASSVLTNMNQSMPMQNSPYKYTPLSVGSYIKYSAQNGPDSESKTLKYPTETLEVDFEPVITRKVISSSVGYNWSTRTDQLADIPEIRRFYSDSATVSMYLVLGCILVENLIANDKSKIHEEIVGALRALQGNLQMDRTRKSAFLEAEHDFKTVIFKVQRPKIDKFVDPILRRDTAYKAFYESFVCQPKYAKAIAVATQAVFINFFLKGSVDVEPKFKDLIFKETSWDDDYYIRDLLQLFSYVFCFKLHFLEISNLTGRISRSEFYPYSDSNSYSYEVVLLNILDKEKQYKAFAYPKGQTVVKQQPSLQAYSNYSQQKSFEGSNQQPELVPQQEEKTFNEPQISTSKQSIEQYSDPMPQVQTKTANEEVSTFKPVEYEQELFECSLCHAPLRTSEVFINTECGHRYCIYCIDDSRYIGSFCLYTGCLIYLDAEGLQMFISLKKMGVDEVPQQTTANTSPNTGNVKESPAKKQIEHISCNVCYYQKEKSKMFENPCGHYYCVDCVQASIESGRRFCLSVVCTKLIDLSAMNAFVEQLIADEMRIMTVSCKSCNVANQFEYQKTSKPDYFKCGNCKLVSCLKHEDIMAKCLCYCDQCLNSLGFSLDTLAKSCRGCGKGYCTVCSERKDKISQRCECVCELCFGKKASKSDKICQTCLMKPASCPECYDMIDDSNEFALACGHSICLTCQQMIYEKEAKHIEFRCPVCTALNIK